ncbi:protein of unknown function DUF1622 [Gloeothece citriformis PCC 7424]|uniref:DUF1622 domain-containing protein n=1 Tax=Gloeothece citriformis (strain PCC 7424) TaxID=65393 RepID=B7KKX9_GLOC7|nr:DUF1622 domain-containing protein [Gloeothece citriformis]ACK71098.1 protein of unknown function DUF1622 [Gloeothece citriformis PCC 7424]
MSLQLLVRTLNGYTVSLCQFLALIVIVSGVIKAIIIYGRNIFSTPQSKVFQASRLSMGYSFSLGLSFLIGASILKSTIAPTWNDIGQLAAIISLRTVLNYLLLQAIKGDTESHSSPEFTDNNATQKDKLIPQQVD